LHQNGRARLPFVAGPAVHFDGDSSIVYDQPMDLGKPVREIESQPAEDPVPAEAPIEEPVEAEPVEA
jgi:hypothetical protein